MPRSHRRIPPIAAVGLSVLLCVFVSSAIARPAPLFVPSPHGPYRLGEAPVAVMAGNFDPQGPGFDDYLVGYARGSKANLFYSSRKRPGRLVRLARLSAPTGPSAFGGYPGNEFAILSSGTDQARVFFSNSFEGDRIEAGDTVATGRNPVAAVFGDFGLAVANRGSNDLWLYDTDYRGGLKLSAKVALGPEPTAAVREECCISTVFVTTAGDDRVTLLRNLGDERFQTRRSYPVGDRPSALTLGDFVEGDYRDEEIAVANRGSDSVTVLDDANRGTDFQRVGTYPVGHEPTAIVKLDADERGGWDLAVANAGSDSRGLPVWRGRG